MTDRRVQQRWSWPPLTLAVTWLVLAASACTKPTPTPTPIIPPSSTATSTAAPSLTPTPSTTPSPTTSPTPTYALTPAAVMRLADAEREVLSWLDSARSPRVERAFYVTEGDVRAAAPELDNYGWFAVEHQDLSRTFPIQDSPQLLVVIQASTAGMDIQHTAGQHVGQEPSSSNASQRWPSLCSPVPSTRRQGVVAIFDATTGQGIGHGLVYEEVSTVLAALASHGRQSLPASTALAPPTDVNTPTPSPTVPPEMSAPSRWDPDFAPRQLGIGEVPAALVDAAREYPMVNGSTWTYRRSSHRDGVSWWHNTYTVTIVAAWQVAPDAMVVRAYDGSAPGACGYIMLSSGVFSECETMSLAAMRAALATPLPPPDAPEWGQPEGRRPELARIPFQVWTTARVGREGVPEREDVVSVPAGRFRGCFETRSVQSAANSIAEWTCRGVGLVRRDSPQCSSMYGGHDADELMHYWIPPIKLLEANQ